MGHAFHACGFPFDVNAKMLGWFTEGGTSSQQRKCKRLQRQEKQGRDSADSTSTLKTKCWRALATQNGVSKH